MSNLVVRIIAQNLTKAGFTGAAKNVKSFGAGVEAASAKLAKMALVTAAVGAVGLVKFAAFDKSIREIGTLLDDVTENDIKVMGREIEKMSIRFGQSVEKMAKAKYDIVSAGFTGAAESAKLLDVSARLAAGGVTEVSKTADVLTSVLNAYGASADDATYYSDTLFTTVRLGKTTMDQLASGLGRAAAIAPQVGVGFDELSAAVATLTLTGQSTDEVVTALTATMITMLKPPEELKDRFKELGFASGSAMIQAEGFGKTLAKLTEGLSEAEKAALFPNVRALRAVFPLTGTMAGKFTETLAEMQNVAGATDKAFGVMADGIAFKLAQLRQVGEKVLRRIGEQFANLVELFLAAEPATKNLIISIGGLGLAFKFLGVKLTLVAGLVGFVFKTMETNFMGIGKRISQLGEQIKHFVTVMGISISTIAISLKEVFTGNFDAMQDVLKQANANMLMETARHNSMMININQAFLEKYTEDWNSFIPDISTMLGLNDVGGVEEASTANADAVVNNLFDPLQQARMKYGIDSVNRTKEYAKKRYEVEDKYNKDLMRANEDAANMQWYLANDTLSRIAGSFGEHTAVVQAALVVQSMMDTYAAANRALASLPPPWSFIAAAAVTAAGFANVARIRGMSRGGIVDDKPIRAQTGTVAQGFDTQPALLRPGEAVIPTEFTRENMPTIRQLINGQPITGQNSDGGSGGGSNISINITAIDTQGIKNFVEGGEFRDALVDALNDENIRLEVGSAAVVGVR